jgi:hypothetical protein
LFTSRSSITAEETEEAERLFSLSESRLSLREDSEAVFFFLDFLLLFGRDGGASLVDSDFLLLFLLFRGGFLVLLGGCGRSLLLLELLPVFVVLLDFLVLPLEGAVLELDIPDLQLLIV